MRKLFVLFHEYLHRFILLFLYAECVLIKLKMMIMMTTMMMNNYIKTLPHVRATEASIDTLY